MGWRATKAARLPSRVADGGCPAPRRGRARLGLSTVPGQIALARMPSRDEIGRDGFRQADHRRLGGAVDEAVRRGDDRGDGRGHVDDAAAAVFQHGGQEAAGHLVHGPHVQPPGKVEILGVAVEDRAVVDEARAIEQDVYRTRLGGEIGNGRVVGHVEAVGLRPGLGHGRQRVSVDVGGEDLGALGEKGPRRRLPDARPGRGDQGALAFQSHHLPPNAPRGGGLVEAARLG
jgi:hypothetical protein